MRQSRHAPFVTLVVLLAACGAPEPLSEASADASFNALSTDLPGYQWIPLGDLGGGGSFVNDLNDRGQVVGSAFYTSMADAGPSHAFVWENGVMHDLGTLGGASSVANDINEHGQIVGSASAATGRGQAVIWENRSIRSLGSLRGGMSIAEQINDRGEILGKSEVTDDAVSVRWVQGVIEELPLTGAALNNNGAIAGWTTTDGKRRAAVWENGVLTDLGTLGGDESWAVAIDDDGRVVGTSRTASGELHAVMWHAGEMRDLGVLEGTSYSQAITIGSHGTVAGDARVGPTSLERKAWVWNDGVMQDLGNLGGTYATAADINEQGMITGTATIQSTASVHRRAFVWSAGVMRNLGTGAGSFSLGRRINRSGLVAGVTEYRPSSTMVAAAVWVPLLPTP